MFYPENLSIFKIVWKNIVKRGRPQMTQYGACALHAGLLKLHTHTHTHTLRICNTCYFSTATMVKRTPLTLHYTHIACLVILHYREECKLSGLITVLV